MVLMPFMAHTVKLELLGVGSEDVQTGDEKDTETFTKLWDGTKCTTFNETILNSDAKSVRQWFQGT